VKMVLAAALDHRTKQLAGIPAEQHDMVYAELRAMLLATSVQYSADAEATASTEAAAVADDDDADSKPDLFAGLVVTTAAVQEAAAVPEPALLAAQADHELHMFRGLAPLTRKASPAWDPMEWWARHYKQLPLLSELARKVLCIPATSASSERVFSTTGLTVTAKRNRLSEDQAGRLVFLRGSWEAVAALSRAALAESTITSTSTTATTGSGSIATAASGSTSTSTITAAATGADNAAAGNAAVPASAAASLNDSAASSSDESVSSDASDVSIAVTRSRKRSKQQVVLDVHDTSELDDEEQLDGSEQLDGVRQIEGVELL
jgi:hAT family C-terminal dimerisation region